jgi:secondary thiamine-phosphate synthase enzyme
VPEAGAGVAGLADARQARDAIDPAVEARPSRVVIASGHRGPQRSVSWALRKPAASVVASRSMPKEYGTRLAMERRRILVGMKNHQGEIARPTKGRGLYDITQEIASIVRASGVSTGLCTIFVQHTSCSLVIQENADPSVRRDMERWISRLAPEGSDYEHDAEGPDDMPSHLRSVVTKTSETIPITRGALALGTWQAVYLWEHRRVHHTRNIVVHVMGA